MTCRRLVAHASQNAWPLLCIHAMRESKDLPAGSVGHIPLKRSLLAIRADESLAFDPVFMRHYPRVLEKLREFKPDIIHITGLNDVSIIGAFAAHKLQIPLIASWHTNLHEFAAKRLTKGLRFLPKSWASGIASTAEKGILAGATLYYQMPKIVLAPNQELIDLLESRTGRSARLMGRGVDTNLYSPQHRTVNDGVLRLGFAGRLRAEKNLDMLVEIDNALQNERRSDYQFLIVGDGVERKHLKQKLGDRAVFTGYLEGNALAEAYANMDLFVFPSESETFGNVIQEANASGVPAVVTSKGGPKFIVWDGETGFVANDRDEFVARTIELIDNRGLLASMKENARKFALSRSWNSVFAGVLDAYLECIDLASSPRTVSNYRNSTHEESPAIEDFAVK